MFSTTKRFWKYGKAKVNAVFNDHADPKVLLEQAMAQAQKDHQRLLGQAATVMANQKQVEMRLNRSMDELERTSVNAKKALQMAAEATDGGDLERAAELNDAAASFANRLIQMEEDVEDLKELALQSADASVQAKQAAQQDSRDMQHMLQERQRLLSQLDQAKMQESVAKTMQSLNVGVGGDVPTLGDVRDKIEMRYAKARSMTELSGGSVSNQMAEIERAAADSEAQARLSQMRGELGLPEPEPANVEISEATSG